MSRRLVLRLLFVGATAINLGCASKQQPTSHEEELLGFWVSESYLSQLGETHLELCLGPDGQFREVFVSQGAVDESVGTYSISAGRLIMHSEDYVSTAVQPLRFENGVLVLIEDGEYVRRFHRQADSCDVHAPNSSLHRARTRTFIQRERYTFRRAGRRR